MRILLLLPLALALGCNASSTTPPVALAPGYSSQADQTLGQSLAAINAFVAQEKLNYVNLPANQQITEKTYLNSLIDAVNLANAAYTAFHGGGGTLPQAQAAFTKAQSAQAALTAAMGVK